MTPRADTSEAVTQGTLPSLPVTYHEALAEYLAHPDEATLQQAYELGRAAMNAGLGIVDIIRLHHQAMADGALPRDMCAGVPGLESFLLEALSPFEAAYRGFRGARERLQQINGVLAERNEELSKSNANLEEEIRVRQRVEGALRESKDHYFKLFQQAHNMERDLRELSAKVLSVQEDERKRISRELHDEIGQALTAVNVAIAVLKKQAHADGSFVKRVADAEQLIEQTMETVHRFARELRPAMLDHLGVHSALRAHVALFTQRTGIKTELLAHPDLSRIDGARSEVLFRVAQEALNNVFKHAKATAVKIEFTSSGDGLTMEVADNGCSFLVEDKLGEKATGRLGLLGMKERVRHVNGNFTIESAPSKGTRVRVKVPFESPPKHPMGGDETGSLFPMPPPGGSPGINYENNIRTAC
ncbi:MAG TPA: histidine kinase [Opitutaceae bacterium]|jgi:signal transduction histidine kinase|nr:histidine kinase [Opitutaceae bacterium]